MLEGNTDNRDIRDERDKKAITITTTITKKNSNMGEMDG